MPALISLFSSWNPRKKQEKERYLKTFSISNWRSLPISRKREHSFDNCKGCHQYYSEAQSLLPVKSNRFQGVLKENPFLIASNEVPKYSGSLKKGEISATAKALYSKIDKTFQEKYSVSFADALIKVPELGIQKKKSPEDKKKERRAMYRHYKNKVEEEWEKTSLLR